MSDEFSTPRRTDPITPVLQALPVVPFFVVFAFGPGGAIVADLGVPLVVAVGLAVVVSYALAVLGLWLGWSRKTFWLDEEGDLRVDSGVVQRSARRLQLSRLQSVDIASPFLARLVGLVEVRVEVAGVGDSRVVLRYLRSREGEALRAAILVKSRDVPAEGATPLEPAQTTEAQLLAEVPPLRLLAGLLMRSVTAGLLLLSVVFMTFTLITQGPVGGLLAIATGGLPILIVFGEFLTYYGFTVSRAHDGLRLTYGLLSTQRRTVPAERVHAIELISPLLWRRRGWVRVSLTVAGVGDEAGTSGRDVLLPVAPLDQALRVIAEVLPGVDIEEFAWRSAPVQARWRAPIDWGRLAVAMTGDVVAARSGRITGRIAVAPYARVQSVRLTQGPYERRLGLASVHADLAPGPVRVTAQHQGLDSARALTDLLAQRARLARGRDLRR